MKHRVIGTVLFALGVLLLVMAVGLRFYVAPTATKIPYDLKPSKSIVLAKNATFLQIADGVPTIHTGDITSSTDVVPRPDLTDEKMTGDLKGKAVVWDVYSETRAVSDNSVVDASTEELALDRVSGAAADWDGAWENSSDAPKGSESKTKFSGQAYKMPFNSKKESYDFWDGTLGKTFPARFKAVEKVNGVEVYRYEQVVPLQQAPLDPVNEAVLSASFAPGSTGGDLYYSNTRTLWAEPVTGQFLNVREQRHIEFRADNGVTTTLLDADFNYTQATVDKAAKDASSNRTMIMAVRLYVPIVAGLVGLALIVLAFIVMRRDPERGSGGGAHAEDRAARQMSDA